MIDKSQWVLGAKYPQVSLRKWQKTVTLMADLFKAPAGFLVQYGGEDKGYQVTVSSEHAKNPYPAGSMIPPDTNIFCKKVVAEARELYVADATEDSYWDDNPEVADDGFRSYYGLPVCWPDGAPFGTLCVMDFKKTHYQQPYLSLLEQFRDLIESDLALLMEYKKVENLSLTDELTGLYNRRGFMAMAEQEINLARRYGHLFAMLYLDIDRLKEVNDNFGHDEGDRVIRLVAEVIDQQLREADLAARIGGDEFVALVFLRNQREADGLVDRIRGQVAAACKNDPALQPSGVSIGCAFFDADSEETVEAMLNTADKLMYADKGDRGND